MNSHALKFEAIYFLAGACVTVNTMILIWIMSANLAAACVAVRLEGAVNHRFLALTDCVRDSEPV